MGTMKDLQLARKIAREQRLKDEQNIGKARAKSFGGKPSPREDRRKVKKDLRH